MEDFFTFFFLFYLKESHLDFMMTPLSEDDLGVFRRTGQTAVKDLGLDLSESSRWMGGMGCYRLQHFMLPILH